jgi:hypothetical protein
MKNSTNVTSYNSNGEVISLEDIAKKTEINTGDIATLEKLAKANLYNLGVYDSVVDNGDGTGTITRKTIYNDDGTQSEATTSYIETIILNQPIHILNQDMEQRVREEVEKGLNLYKLDNITCKLNNTWYAEYKLLDNVQAGTYKLHYKLTVNSGDTPTRASIGYGASSYENDYISYTISEGVTFTVTSNIVGKNIYWRPVRFTDSTGSGSYTISEIMLTKGAIAYPYQPYHGEIMRTADVPFYFSTSSTSPASTIGGTWTSLGSFTVGSNTVYAWKRA